MRTTKIWFGLLILFFFLVISLAPLAIKYYQNEKYTRLITYEPIDHNSCHIGATEPTIVLRIDDIRAYSVPAHYLIDEILNRKLSVVLGVIPRNLEKDKGFIDYLQKIRTNPLVEIAQHGTEHNENDMDITNESLKEGNIKIQELVGVKPVTYITPFNEISSASREIVSHYFRIISGKQGVIKEGEEVAEIGYTAATYDYANSQEVSIETIVSKCEDALNKTNLCVIMIHPQEYSSNINNSKSLSEDKFNEFKDLLTRLQELDARFSTFNDIVSCN